MDMNTVLAATSDGVDAVYLPHRIWAWPRGQPRRYLLGLLLSRLRDHRYLLRRFLRGTFGLLGLHVELSMP